jgi:hypothetical protein
MKQFLLAIAVLALYVLHQDVWFWRSVTPLAFGVLPAGLWYHVAYTLAVAGLMWLLVRHAWPVHLESVESDAEARPEAREGRR